MAVMGNRLQTSRGNTLVTNFGRQPDRVGLKSSSVGSNPAVTVLIDAIGPSDGNGASNAVTSGQTSITWKHKVGPGPNRAILVEVTIGAGTDSMTTSVVFKKPGDPTGVAFTSIGKVHANNQTAGYTEQFWLPSPTVCLGDIVVTTSATPISIVGGSISMFNATQSTPSVTTAFGSSAAPSVNAPSGPAGSLNVSSVSIGSALTSSNNTKIFINNRSSSSGGGNGGMSVAYPGDGVVAMSWVAASDWWGAIAANILPTLAADPTFTTDTPLWSGTYENGDLSEFDQTATYNYQPSTPTVGSTSPAPARGLYRGAYSIPAGASPGGAGVAPRCESEPLLRQLQEGDDLWFGGYTYLDPAFPYPAAGEFSVFTQWKNNGSGSPPLELSVNNDSGTPHYRVDGGYGYPGSPQQWIASDSNANAAVRGVWVRWDLHVVFSSNPALARLDVWKDAVQIVTNYQFPTLAGTLYPGLASYWKIGYYRSESINGAGTIFHDEWAAGPTAASVNFGALLTTNDLPGWAYAMNI